MQLGSRWQAGDAPHPGVPAALHGAIADVELRLGNDVSGASWTLTWLEGRAHVELIDARADLRADLSIAADGSVVAQPIRSAGASAGSPGYDDPKGADTSGFDSDDDDDDDDWLS